MAYDMAYGFRATSGYVAPENSWLDVSLIKNGNTLTANTNSNSVSWTASSLGSYPRVSEWAGQAQVPWIISGYWRTRILNRRGDRTGCSKKNNLFNLQS